MSHLSLFGKFKRKFGLTGTVGGVDEIDFMERNFKVNVVKVPQFADKRFAKFKGQIYRTRREWENAVVNGVRQQIDQSMYSSLRF